MPVDFNSAVRTWTLSGGDTSYVLHRDEQDRLLNLYWGRRIPADALCFDPADYSSFAAFDLPVSVLPLELPVCGSGWFGTPAVGIRDARGDEVVDLRIRKTDWRVRIQSIGIQMDYRPHRSTSRSHRGDRSNRQVSR